MAHVLQPIDLPTPYAEDVAIRAELLDADEMDCHPITDYEKKRRRLAMFQQMSISSTFEKCMMLYLLEVDLTEKQVSALEIIYQNTRDWILGHMTGELLKKLSSKFTTGRDANDIARTIIEVTKQKDEPGKQSILKRSLIIKEATLTEEERMEYCKGEEEESEED